VSRGRLLALALLVSTLGACAYFNALYNARQLYADARRAAERGDLSTAERDHRESLDKAARSFRHDPDGRWADDALLLVGQNHFALGDCTSARAALQRVIDSSPDAELVGRASAYLGAVHVCLEEPAAALPHLDLAIDRIEAGSASAAFARLWRARALFALDSSAAAWSDLAIAVEREDAVGREASLEQVSMALADDRSDMAVAGIARLLADSEGDLYADSIVDLADASAERWGGAVARQALADAARAPWPGEARDRLVVVRASHAAAAGDTATALEELSSAASRLALGPATEARLRTAALQLASAEGAADLEAVRSTLLPALTHPRARETVQSVALVGALLERARLGQPLGFFAAAEVARDRLGADGLAIRLFQSYAEVAGEGPWATKARLAALALGPDAQLATELRNRIAGAGDVYAAASGGAAAEGFEDAERRLEASLSALVQEAQAAVQDQDVAVGRAIAEFDSIAAAAQADSVRLACGTMLDSLGIGGIRRDSVRAACLREQVALVDSYLLVDTLLLRDSTAQRARAEEQVQQDPAGQERPQ